MTQSKYTIADLSFQTKSEIKAHYQHILNSYVPGDTLTASDFVDVIELLKHHHGYEIKVEGGVKDIKVDWMQYGTRCFHIIHDDNSCIDFSYIECIKGIKKNDTTRTATPVS